MKFRCGSRVTFYYLISLLLLLPIPVIFYYLISLNSISRSNSYDDVHLLMPGIRQSLVVASNSSTQNGKMIKKILFWTSFFEMKDFGFGLGQNPFIQAKCRVANCLATTDRSLLNQADAVMFHPVNLDPNDLPPHRMSHQRYVFFFYEANVYFRSLPTFQNPAINRRFFNWTMTYRRDSDIYGSRYTSIRRRHHPSHAVLTLDKFPSTSTPDELPPDPVTFWQFSGNQSQQEKHPVLANRTKWVAWFVSNCKTSSLREVFFRQMAKFIPVDIYGDCGTLKCTRTNDGQCDTLLDSYKFYISAENSLCADYVTEKFYRALASDIVPIVYGGADYSAYAPPHSYINAADFESPQSLAEHLLLLDRNPRLYAKYVDWKRDWQMSKLAISSDSFCRLCEKLNDNNNNISFKIYEDMADWLYDKVPCLPGTSVMAKYDLHFN